MNEDDSDGGIWAWVALFIAGIIISVGGTIALIWALVAIVHHYYN